MKIEFALTRKAKGSGGDRYETIFEGRKWVIYLPQSLSRKDGMVKSSVTLTLDQEIFNVEIYNNFKCDRCGRLLLQETDNPGDHVGRKSNLQYWDSPRFHLCPQCHNDAKELRIAHAKAMNDFVTGGGNDAKE